MYVYIMYTRFKFQAGHLGVGPHAKHINLRPGHIKFLFALRKMGMGPTGGWVAACLELRNRVPLERANMAAH